MGLRVRLRTAGQAVAPGHLAGTLCTCHLAAILPFASATPKGDRFGSREFRIKAGNYEEVVTLTGMAKPSVIARATRLRKAGVKLPKYGRAHRIVDVKGLNELIGSLAPKPKPRKPKKAD